MKLIVDGINGGGGESLSLRRAWIEMRGHKRHAVKRYVALLTESVD